MKRLLVFLLLLSLLGCGSSGSPQGSAVPHNSAATPDAGKKIEAELEKARSEKAALEEKLAALESKETAKPVSQTETTKPVAVGPQGTVIADEKRIAAKTVQEAREELQRRIDQVLGGEKIDKLFFVISVSFVGESIETLEIVRVVQMYDKEGNILPNQFTGVIKLVLVNTLYGTKQSQQVNVTHFAFQKGAWSRPFWQ